MEPASTSAGSENLRGAGLRKNGRIRVGRPVPVEPGAAPFSSIPTKFEIAARHHNSEEKAFGSREPRFVSKPHVLPGPGAYFKPGSLMKEGDSISRRGYGSLTSSDVRWRHIAPHWTGPGPGEYQGAAAPPGRGAFSRATTTANFHSRREPPGQQGGSGDAAALGPGSYEHMGAHYRGTAVKWVDTPHTGQASAFKARPREFALAGNRDAPGAGRYELAKDWSTQETQYSQFKNHSKREAELHADEGVPAIIFNDHDSHRASGPGPGAYNMQAVGSIHRKISNLPGKATSAFVSGVVDRFGCPLAPKRSAGGPPGPGTYRPPAGAFDGKSGIASSFVSTASKSALLNEKTFRDLPPGPAYYKPVKSEHKSHHHVNARRRFLSAV